MAKGQKKGQKPKEHVNKYKDTGPVSPTKATKPGKPTKKGKK